VVESYYIKGLRTRDFSLIRAICVPEKILYGVKQNSELNITTLNIWSAKFDPSNPPFKNLDYEIGYIDFEGKAVQVKIKFIVNHHTIIYDYLNLLKIEGQWKIINIIDY